MPPPSTALRLLCLLATTLLAAGCGSDTIHPTPAPTGAHDWGFDQALDNGWGAHSIDNFAASGGVLSGDITGDDPYFHTPDGLRFFADVTTGIEIRMRVNAGTQAELYWITSSDPTWGASKGKAFTITPDDQWHTYTLQFQRNRSWMGFITQLRIDPTTANSGSFSVDYVKVLSSIPTGAHLVRSGYYHVEDDRYGHHMDTTAAYSHFVHLAWGNLPNFRATVERARRQGLAVIPELSLIFVGHPEAQWETRLREFVTAVRGLEGSIACIDLVDEPLLFGMGKAAQERAVTLTRRYFPDTPLVINYAPLTRSPAEVASNLDWISFDSYEADEMRQQLAHYAGFGKPTIFIGKAFTWNSKGQSEADELLVYTEGTYDLAKTWPEVVYLWWFMYNDAVHGGQIYGAKNFPRVVERHKQIYAELPQ